MRTVLSQTIVLCLTVRLGKSQVLTRLQPSNSNLQSVPLSLLLGDLNSLDRTQRQSSTLPQDSIGSSFGSFSSRGQNSQVTPRPSLTLDDSLSGLLGQSPGSQDTMFSQRERNSLISHLVGLQNNRDSKLVLTPRQRLALEEETRLRQLSATARPSNSQELLRSFLGRNRDTFDSSDSLQSQIQQPEISLQSFQSQQPDLSFQTSLSSLQPQREPSLQSSLQTTQFLQSSLPQSVRRPEQPRRGSQSQAPFLPELVLNTQTQPETSVSSVTTGHPSQILNSLPLTSQEKFLEQFLSLSPDHQSFVYRKLLSSPPDIQQFAIEQFVSLDNRVLVVSIQAEIERENKGKAKLERTNLSPNRNILQSQFSPSLGARADGSGFIGPMLPSGPSVRTNTALQTLEELVARSEQRQLAEQEEQLRSIIDFQKRREAGGAGGLGRFV